jgi:hypothetical protein
MASGQKHAHCDSNCGCCLSIGRRDFLTTVGLSALAVKSATMGLAAEVAAAVPKPASKPRVRAVFCRPETDSYWMGWPGASYNIKERQADYTKRMTDAAKAEGVDLQVTAEPITDAAGMNVFLEECKAAPPDGVVVTVMSLNSGWKETNRFVAERPPEIPTIVFSPMGTSFTGHLQGTRNKPKTLVAATQDLNWLAEGIHLFKTIGDMKASRLCIVNGNKTEDKVLEVIGTTLHYIPLARWEEELKKAGQTDEMKQLAAQFTKQADAVREPNVQDIFNSAQNYFVAKQIMADEKCDGISLNCLGLVGSRRIACPPCMAWLQLNDEGSVGCCECDWNAAISLRLCALLTGKPGFMQDPCPNTVAGTLMGAHCSSPTKLRGFDKDPEPLILRNHSESAIGVSPQVIWPLGEPATVMKFEGPQKIIVGTGKVVSNIDTPPAGGCRTSVELEMDDTDDPRDCKGFHQLFIHGNLARTFKNYSELAGIEVTPV